VPTKSKQNYTNTLVSFPHPFFILQLLQTFFTSSPLRLFIFFFHFFFFFFSMTETSIAKSSRAPGRP